MDGILASLEHFDVSCFAQLFQELRGVLCCQHAEVDILTWAVGQNATNCLAADDEPIGFTSDCRRHGLGKYIERMVRGLHRMLR